MSAADFYVDTTDIFKSVKSGTEVLDIDKESDLFDKLGRKATNYHPGLFEWTHFRAQVDGNFMFILVKNIIEKL